MTAAVSLARPPFFFLCRCALAFVEIAVALAILCTAVVAGHDLKEFRAWYADPGTIHYWAPTPSPSQVAEPR